MLTEKSSGKGVTISPNARSSFEWDQAVKKSEAHYKQTLDIMRNTLGPKFANAAKKGTPYNGSIAADIYAGEYTPAQITSLLKRLDQHAPAVADDLRSNFSKFLNNQLVNRSTQRGVNLGILDNVLDNKKSTIISMFWGEITSTDLAVSLMLFT